MFILYNQNLYIENQIQVKIKNIKKNKLKEIKKIEKKISKSPFVKEKKN